MDSHCFRIFSSFFINFVQNARIDKIYNPYPHVVLFRCFGQGKKFGFAVRTDKQNLGIFFVTATLPNPSIPSAPVMRLRKYLTNSHFGAGMLNYSTRSLAFPLLRKSSTELWLIIDLRKGILLSDRLPEEFATPALWPNASCIHELTTTPFTKNASVGAWTTYPLLTPLLRETLAELDVPDALALMVDLEAGGDSLFFYEAHGALPSFYSAWPLPDSICAERKLQESASYIETLGVVDTLLPAIPKEILALSIIENNALLHAQSLAKRNHPVKNRQARKLEKTLRSLEAEEKRMCALVDKQKTAKVLQAHLWQIDATQKLTKISFPDHTFDQEPRRNNTDKMVTDISLDPTLSVKENMEKLFRQAEKGKRGLPIVLERKKTIVDELAIVKTKSAKPQLPQAQEVALSTKRKKVLNDVAAFTSSDGYTILRGKNAQGNQTLLKIGSSHDYWLHISDGPSAHAIIRRAHAQDSVPEKTIEEAAALVGEKSWRKDDSKVEVILALLQHVKSITGAKAGTVRVDKVQRHVIINI